MEQLKGTKLKLLQGVLDKSMARTMMKHFVQSSDLSL